MTNESRQASEKTALVADDSREIRALVAKLLVARGWRVHTCGDGLSAIQLLDDYRFDAVIADMQMPGLAGSRLLEYARGVQPHARLCFMSGWGEGWALRHAQRLGATILSKPFRAAELYAAVGEPHA